MNLKNIIKLFYIGYMVYILMVIQTTSLTFLTLFPSILIMLINYIVFATGYNLHKKKNNSPSLIFDKSGWLNNRGKLSLLMIAGISVVFSILAVKYYTGQTPVSVFSNLRSAISLYHEYQAYFKEAKLNVFSLSKLPYIFMLFYIKFLFFYSYLSFFSSKNKLSKLEKFYIFLVTISFIYVGTARGTNFEFFEFVMLLIFIMTSKKNATSARIPISNLIKIVLLITAMNFVFYAGIEARGFTFDFYISDDVLYDPNGFVSTYLPFLSLVVFMTYSYFGFGFYYMSSYTLDMWFSSIDSFIAGLVPFGYLILDNSSIRDNMRSLVDMGVRWHPESAVIIGNFGYVGLLLICFSLGVFSKYLNRRQNIDNLAKLTQFIILLFMVSLPIGNFVTASSASLLITLSLILYWGWVLIIKNILKST